MPSDPLTDRQSRVIAGTGSPAIVALVLTLLATLIALGRLRTIAQPLDRDITTYVVIGREMLHGRALYSDLWDHKPPLIHVVFAAAQSAVGEGPASVYLVGVLSAVGGMLGAYAAVRWAGAPRSCGLWAAGFWTILSFWMSWQSNLPNCEALMNLAAIWMFALFMRRRDATMGWPAALAIGVLAALGTLVKHVAVLTFAGPALAYVVCSGGATERARRAGRMGAALAVIAVAWVATGAYFALTGRWGDFYDAVIRFNLFYTTGEPDAAVLALEQCVFPLLGAVLPAGVVLAAHHMGWLKRPTEPLWLQLGLSVGSAAAVLVPRHAYSHYIQLLIPPLVSSLGLGLWIMLDPPAPRRRALPQVLAGLTLLPALAYAGLSLSMAPEVWSIREHGPVFVRVWHEAPILRELLKPGETFWNLGSDSGLYVLTGQSPPAGVFYDYPLFDGPLAQRLTRRTLEQLERRPPDLVVVTPARMQAIVATPEQDSHPLVAWLRQHYRAKAAPPGATFLYLARIGSDLERRMANRNAWP